MDFEELMLYLLLDFEDLILSLLLDFEEEEAMGRGAKRRECE